MVVLTSSLGKTRQLIEDCESIGTWTPGFDDDGTLVLNENIAKIGTNSFKEVLQLTGDRFPSALHDCDSTDNTTVVADCTISVNNTTYKYGTGALNVTKGSGNADNCGFDLNFSSQNFADSAGKLTFWLYIKDQATLDKISGLTFYATHDSSGWNRWRNTDTNPQVALPSIGWNFYRVTVTVPGGEEGGGADETAIIKTRLRINTNNSTDTWSEGDVIIDDLRRYTQYGYGSIVNLSYNGDWTGHSGKDRIGFWVYISDITKFTNTVQLSFGDVVTGGTQSCKFYIWSVSSDGLQNGWNWLSAPIEDFSTSGGYTIDYSNIAQLRITTSYMSATDTRSSTPYTPDEPTQDIYIDNITIENSEGYVIKTIDNSFVYKSNLGRTSTTDPVAEWALNGDATDKIGTNNGSVIVNADGYYPFQGNANDASPNGNNGIISGAALSTDRFSNANSAYYFSGLGTGGQSSDQSITIPNFGDYSQGVTIAAWCKAAHGSIWGTRYEVETTSGNTTGDDFGSYRRGQQGVDTSGGTLLDWVVPNVEYGSQVIALYGYQDDTEVDAGRCEITDNVTGSILGSVVLNRRAIDTSDKRMNNDYIVNGNGHDMRIRVYFADTTNVYLDYINYINSGYNGIIEKNNGIDFAYTGGTYRVWLNGLGNYNTGNVIGGEWQHVGFTYDNSDIKMYRNGSLLGTKSFGGSIADLGEDFRIGVYNGAPFWGEIDDVFIKGGSPVFSDEQMATLFDTSNTHDLNIPYISGRSGEVGDFDGLTSYINVDNDSTLNFNADGEMSLSFWVYPNDVTDDTIITKEGNAKGYRLELGGDVINNLRMKNPNGWGYYEADVVIPASVWTHCVMTYNNQIIKFYINGIMATAFTGTPGTWVSDTTSDIKIGKKGTKDFNGKLDDLRFYDRAINSDEVESLYNYGNGDDNTQTSSFIRQTIKAEDNTFTFTDSNTLGITPADISGCVFFMDMNSITAGSYITDSVGGRIGSIIGSELPDLVEGRYASGLGFHGGSSALGSAAYVEVGSPTPFEINNDASVSTWVKLGSHLHSDAGQIFGMHNYNFWFKYYNGTSITCNFNIISGTGNKDYSSTFTGINRDEWTHLTATRNATTGSIHLYKNGELNNQFIASGTIRERDHTIRIGAYNGYPEYQNLSLSGCIDNVALFNKELTQQEVANLYNLHTPKYITLKQK